MNTDDKGSGAKIGARELFAKQLEKTYLDKGLDVYVCLDGADKTTSQLKFVLMSRPLVHQFANNTDTIAALRKAGCKKVRLPDGYDHAWRLDLS